MAKSSNSKMAYGDCNPYSIKEGKKALGSSPDTVNPFSIRKSGKALVKGK